MLTFLRKYKAGDIWHRSFDDEVLAGLYGKLVCVYFDGTHFYYEVDILGDAPTDEEQREIVDEVESMFYDQLYLAGSNDRELETPSKECFQKEKLHCFTIS
jgi:hypothetical protein